MAMLEIQDLHATVDGHEILKGLTLTVRDQLVERMLETQARYHQQDAKQVYYLSIEFLIGRSLFRG